MIVAISLRILACISCVYTVVADMLLFHQFNCMTNQLIRVVCKPCLNQFHRVMVFVYSFFSPLLYYGTKHYVPRLHGISTKFPLVKYNYVAAKYVNLNLVLY